MKRIKSPYTFFLPPMMVLLIAGCGRSDKNELKALMEKRDSLLQVNNTKDMMIRSFSVSFDEIEKNLDLIRQREGLLKMHAGSTADIADKRTEINRNINEINELMSRNTYKIHALNAQMKRTQLNNEGLKNMITSLAGHMMVKNDELIGLSGLLNKKDKQLAVLGNTTLSLVKEIKNQDDTINADQHQLNFKDQELNTVFYFIGSIKELKAKHLLDEHGKLVSNFNRDVFTAIDARNEPYIPGNKLSEKAIIRVLTPHPAGSYEFIKNDQGKIVNLKIKDQNEFWRISRYLILETK